MTTTPALDVDTFAAHLALAGLADHTIRNYSAMYLRWCDWCLTHGRDPAAPDPLAVRAFAGQLTGGRSLIAHARATIKHLCDLTGTPPCADAIPLPPAPRKPVEALDRDIARMLVQHATVSGLRGTATLVGLYTAFRRSEIASLAWDRVDFERGKVTAVRPKNKDRHTVPLHPALAAHLEPRRVPGEVWLFPGRYGGHVSPATIARWVSDVAVGAGVGHVRSHQLRKTAVTDAYEVTGDLMAAAEFAGHRSTAVTQRYVRLSSRRLAAAVAALDYGEIVS